MPPADFIIEWFCRVDDALRTVPKHRLAHRWPSELVTLGILFALKATSTRIFYGWIKRDYKSLFPSLPDRTRVFRLLVTHQEWPTRFLAQPTLWGVADSEGIALLHPMREGRSPHQIGKKGKSNHRWLGGGKLGLVLNQGGFVTAWDTATANVHDAVFQPLIARFQDEMLVLTDTHFHAAQGDPPHLKVCPRGTWNVRMVVESVCSRLTQIAHCKKVRHRLWAYFHVRVAFTMAMFNVLVQWDGLQPDETGYIHLSSARFAL